MIITVLLTIGQISFFLVSGLLVLVAPGFLVWRMLGSDLRLSPLSALAWWIALSLSIIPIVFLWASTLGIVLTPTVLRVVFFGVALGAIGSWFATSRQPQGTGRDAVSQSPTSNPQPPTPGWLAIGFVVLFGLVALTRWLHIRGIAVPLWVDSVHHTLLVRVIGETGQIPLSLRPYMPIDELPYHWGYHTVVAAWRGLSDTPLVPMVLWSGQVLNALVMPVMYAFGAYLLRSPRAGLIAAGCAGLLSIMPAYYVTWGRYTQLTGLLVLPVLLVASMAVLERRTISWRTLIVSSLLLAGLFLIHYRVLIFYVAFMLPYALLLTIRRPDLIGSVVRRAVMLGGLATVLVAPWAVLLTRRMLVPLASTPGGLIGTDSYNNVDRALLFAGNNRVLFVVAAIGAAFALLHFQWRVVAVVGWISVMFLVANPSLIGLPPMWLINNHAVIITLFIPVSLLVAYLVHEVLFQVARLSAQRSWTFHPSTFILHPLLIGVALWGAWNLRSVVNEQTILATPADLHAIEWIAEHTPDDARFLTNSTPWIGNAPRGTDAGWWVLPLAGRFASTPPALYIYGDATYKQAMDDLNGRVQALTPDNRMALHALVREAQIDYVFLGTRGGTITPAMVRDDPLFVPVYDRDGVLIVEVAPIP